MGQQDAVRSALDQHQWGVAYRLLAERAAGAPLGIDELEWLAMAAYMTGRDEEAFDCWANAHQACLTGGDTRRAARLGLQLSNGLGFKGDIARSSGWVTRVRRVLDEEDADCVEQGFLEYAAGMCRIFEDGDIAGARECFARASKIAHRFGDRELRTLALLGEGRCLVYLGDPAEGLSLLDEAMVSVEAGEISPVVVGDAYCTVIDGCYELFDVRRCEVWTESFTRWCDAQPDLVLYRGNCLLHRAQLAGAASTGARPSPGCRSSRASRPRRGRCLRRPCPAAGTVRRDRAGDGGPRCGAVGSGGVGDSRRRTGVSVAAGPSRAGHRGDPAGRRRLRRRPRLSSPGPDGLEGLGRSLRRRAPVSSWPRRARWPAIRMEWPWSRAWQTSFSASWAT